MALKCLRLLNRQERKTCKDRNAEQNGGGDLQDGGLSSDVRTWSKRFRAAARPALNLCALTATCLVALSATTYETVHV